MKYRPRQIGDDYDVRFALIQKGTRMLYVVGLNPSKANERKSDQTMQSVLRIVEYNGYDGFIMLNLYPKRATAPEDLPEVMDAALHKRNLEEIEKLLVKKGPGCEGNIEEKGSVDVWMAYGNNISRRAYLQQCLTDIIKVFEPHNPKWYYLNTLTKKGHPRHPLYQKADYLKEF